jgi:hypothetical protein
MTITATELDIPGGGSGRAFVLCDGDTRGNGKATGPGEWQQSYAPGVEERRFVGAQGVKPEASGIDAVSLSFAVNATFETPADAMKYEMGLKDKVPRVARIEVDGAAYLARASITHVSGWTGCTVSIKYTLRGY